MKRGDIVEYEIFTGVKIKVQIIRVEKQTVDIGPLSNPWDILITVPIEKVKKVESI